MTTSPKLTRERIFTSYEVFMIAVLAILQFSIILDFMVLSPLGALLIEKLNIKTAQFGLVVSVYAFSAGASGLLAAPTDRSAPRRTASPPVRDPPRTEISHRPPRPDSEIAR